MNTYRITKYNPELRDKNGRYSMDDWTSISDIGNVYGGDVFTLDDYALAEQKYIDCINVIIEEFSTIKFVVTGFECITREVPSQYESIYSEDIQTLLKEVSDGDSFDQKNDVLNLARLVLRENIWCEIELKDSINCNISFGYDYNMYCNTSSIHLTALRNNMVSGMYVEELPR